MSDVDRAGNASILLLLVELVVVLLRASDVEAPVRPPPRGGHPTYVLGDDAGRSSMARTDEGAQ